MMFAAACVTFVLSGANLEALCRCRAGGDRALSKTYRITRANDVEFQKIEPSKSSTPYYVGPRRVRLAPTTPDGKHPLDSAQEPYVDFVNNNIRKSASIRRASQSS
jgi:hypothetical protein